MSDPDRAIPEESRRLVEQRENMRCFMCRGPGSDWHHRRSRRVRAPHRHCACNGVLLCRTCHTVAHSEPERGRVNGTIVSQWVDEPMRVPLMNPYGWWQTVCSGDLKPLKMSDIVTDGMGGFMVSLLDTEPHSGVQ